MTQVNPPPHLEIPEKFLSEPETRVFFEQQRQVLFQLFNRTGGNTDIIAIGENDTIVELIPGLLTATIDNALVTVLGFHTAGDSGGGDFFYDPLQDRANHNGVTIVDPTNTADLVTWDAAAQITWFTAGTGLGCWIRLLEDEWITPEMAGAKSDSTDKLKILSEILLEFDNIKLTDFYPISDALDLKLNHNITGIGRMLCGLKPTANSIHLIDITQVSLTRLGIEISHIGFDAAGFTGIFGIAPTLAASLHFHDLYFKGVKDVFLVDRGRTINIHDILVEGDSPLKAGKSNFTDTTGATFLQELTIDKYFIHNIGNGVESPALKFTRVTSARISDFITNSLFDNVSASADGISITDDCQSVKIIGGHIVKPNIGIRTEDGVSVDPTYIEIVGTDIDQALANSVAFNSGSHLYINGGVFTDEVSNSININTDVVSVRNVDISSSGANGIVVSANVVQFQIQNNVFTNITSTPIVVSTGTSNSYSIVGNNVSLSNGGTIVDNGTGSSKHIHNNIGRRTKNSGTGSITNGGTTDVITHGLGITPLAENISILGLENPTVDIGNIWVDTITSTQFTVNVRTDPSTNNWDFGWFVNDI